MKALSALLLLGIMVAIVVQGNMDDEDLGREVELEGGTLRYANGNVYRGSTKDGHPHGRGMLFYKNGDVYTGDFEMGMMSGAGVFRYKNGDMYKGDYYNNTKHGYGKFDFGDGTYEGIFVMDQMTGKGVFKLKNGNEYTGEFLNNSMHGQGVYKFPNGNVYVGEFNNNSMHGKGRWTFHNGDTYEGDFVEDEMHGIGTYTRSGGLTHFGEFEHGQMEGHGVSQQGVNGEILLANFKNGRAAFHFAVLRPESLRHIAIGGGAQKDRRKFIRGGVGRAPRDPNREGKQHLIPFHKVDNSTVMLWELPGKVVVKHVILLSPFRTIFLTTTDAFTKDEVDFYHAFTKARPANRVYFVFDISLVNVTTTAIPSRQQIYINVFNGTGVEVVEGAAPSMHLFVVNTTMMRTSHNHTNGLSDLVFEYDEEEVLQIIHG